MRKFYANLCVYLEQNKILLLPLIFTPLLFSVSIYLMLWYFYHIDLYYSLVYVAALCIVSFWVYLLHLSSINLKKKFVNINSTCSNLGGQNFKFIRRETIIVTLAVAFTVALIAFPHKFIVGFLAQKLGSPWLGFVFAILWIRPLDILRQHLLGKDPSFNWVRFMVPFVSIVVIWSITELGYWNYYTGIFISHLWAMSYEIRYIVEVICSAFLAGHGQMATVQGPVYNPDWTEFKAKEIPQFLSANQDPGIERKRPSPDSEVEQPDRVKRPRGDSYNPGTGYVPRPDQSSSTGPGNSPKVRGNRTLPSLPARTTQPVLNENPSRQLPPIWDTTRNFPRQLPSITNIWNPQGFAEQSSSTGPGNNPIVGGNPTLPSLPARTTQPVLGENPSRQLPPNRDTQGNESSLVWDYSYNSDKELYMKNKFISENTKLKTLLHDLETNNPYTGLVKSADLNQEEKGIIRYIHYQQTGILYSSSERGRYLSWNPRPELKAAIASSNEYIGKLNSIHTESYFNDPLFLELRTLERALYTMKGADWRSSLQTLLEEHATRYYVQTTLSKDNRFGTFNTLLERNSPLAQKVIEDRIKILRAHFGLKD